MKIDLGCGANKREGYTGVDFGDADKVDVKLDLTTGLPFADGSIEAISSSHFFEHLTDNECIKLMEECVRVASPECEVEIVVPNFPRILEDFLGAEWGRRWTWHLQTIFGLQNAVGEYHKTGFDADKICGMLEFVGFKVVSCEEVWTHEQPSLLVKAKR